MCCVIKTEYGNLFLMFKKSEGWASSIIIVPYNNFVINNTIFNDCDEYNICGKYYNFEFILLNNDYTKKIKINSIDRENFINLKKYLLDNL